MIVAVFIRRLKEGKTFEDFIDAWEADVGFGVPTRVFNAPSLENPRDVMSIGFVAVSSEEFQTFAARPPESEAVRHDRIDDVIESTTLRCQYLVRTEHDFTHLPRKIDLGSAESLLTALVQQREGLL